MPQFNADDVFFRTSGPRRITRPPLTSKAGNRKLWRYLCWMARWRSPDVATWQANHAKSASLYEPARESPAAAGFAECARLVLGEMSDDEVFELRRSAALRYARYWQLMALLTRYRSWTPRIDLGGTLPVEYASHDGPVIYWTDNTVFAPIIGRMALHIAGVKAYQFSDHVHGDGHTLLGKAGLQRLVFALENRYCGPRIVSGPRSHYQASAQLAAMARNRAALFLNNNAFIGRRFACTRIGNGASLVQSAAPLNMARRYNALVVPVSVVEVEPFSHFNVHFDEPLRSDAGLGKDEDISRMAAVSSTRTLRSMRQHPDQWLAWTGGQVVANADTKFVRKAM